MYVYVCIYIHIYIYMCLTYEVLEFEENKPDRLSIKKTYNMLNIHIDVIICIKIYV
jgi:hypothetical protein